MGWLKDILQENRRVVNSWPQWKRRAEMSDEMSETLVAEVGRLRAENAQLKAALELVTASRDTVLERMDWQGKWGRWCAKLQDENNTLKAELAQTKQREARLREALTELYALVRGECPRLLNEDSGGDAELACKIDTALEEAGT